MMRSIHLLFWLLTATVFAPIFAQGPQWVTYANGTGLNDVAFEGDFVWVGSQAGLTKLNKLTGKKQFYLPSNSGLKGFGVNAIHIDDNGMKWLGMSQGGLMRFDGNYDWESFFLTNTGDTLTKVYSMKAHPNGDLWILGNVQGASCYECMKFLKFDGVALTMMNPIFDVNAPNPDLASVQEFDIAPNGDVWAMTGYDIQRYDGVDVVAAFPFDSIMGQFESPVKIHAREADEVFFATIKPSGHNFWRFNGNEWSLDSLGSIQDFNEGIFRFVKDYQGNTWFSAYASSSGETSFYCKYDGTAWQSWKINELPNVPASNQNGPLLLQIDEYGHWWTAVYGTNYEQGLTLFEFDGSQWKGYDNIIFPLNNPYDISFDCYGKAWLAGYNLIQFDGITWRKFTAANMGLSNQPDLGFLSIVLDTANCDLWMSTLGDVNAPSYLIRYHDGVFTPYDLPNGVYPTRLTMGKNGEVWMMHSNGVGRFNGTDWTWFDSSNSPLPIFALSLHVDSQGRVWIGTWDALFVYDNNAWETYNYDNSSITNAINWAFVDRQDIVWVLTYDGFHRFDGTNWETYPLPESQEQIYGMTQDLNGTYWVCTQDGVLWGNDFNSLQRFNVLRCDIKF